MKQSIAQNESVCHETSIGMPGLNGKLDKLENILLRLGKVAVAFSGGVDSTFLLLFANDVLKENAIAVTADAANFTREEMEEAAAVCTRFSITHHRFSLSWKELSHFAHNPENRCYLCKKTVFSRLLEEAAKALPGSVVADGTNLDDCSDYRPGMRALEEMNVRSPLKEAGLTKEEIRFCLKERQIPLWNKPAFACLASRIPYGEPITPEKLLAVELLEHELHNQGFRQCRVRHHGQVARIEVLPEDRLRFLDPELMDHINAAARKAGFAFAALDLRGYRMGSMNQNVEKNSNKE